MAGYHGYSMSNNAVQAYQDGLKPASKWTKDAMLTAIAKGGGDAVQAARLTVAELRSLALRWSEWHHTGKLYNRTDFYEVVPEAVTAEAVQRIIDGRTDVAVRRDRAVKARIWYEVYEGKYRRWKHWVKYENAAVVVGRWAYLPDGSKKDLDGRHAGVIERYGRAPKGTAAVYRVIQDRMPKAVKERMV